MEADVADYKRRLPELWREAHERLAAAEAVLAGHRELERHVIATREVRALIEREHGIGR